MEEGGSLDTQDRQVKEYAASKGYTLITTFREEAESAQTDKRPVLEELLRFCTKRANQVSVVLFPKIDRFARDLDDYKFLKVMLSRIGIRVESLTEQFDDTPAGRFTENVLASVAQFDNEVRMERCTDGMKDAVAQGRWVWPAPFGYRNIRFEGKGTIEPDPTTAPLVQEVFYLLSLGTAPKDVHAHLIAQGITLSRTSFYRMIRSETYLGRIRSFGKIVQGAPPFVALVDEITFHKAQQVIKSSVAPRKYVKDSGDFPLRGTLLCTCGAKLTASWSRGKLHKRYGYYHCRKCQGRLYRRETVHRNWQKELSFWSLPDHLWDQLARQLFRQESAIREERTRKQNSIRKQIAKVVSLQESLVIKSVNGVVPDHLVKAQLNKFEERISELKAGLESEDSPESTVPLIAFASSFLRTLPERWESLTLQAKKDLLRILYPNGVHYVPISAFRTRQSSLQERVNRVLSMSDSTLVERHLQESNDLLMWLKHLHEVMSRTVLEELDLGPAGKDSAA